MTDKLRFKRTSGAVRTERGLRLVRFGDKLPQDLLDADLGRLRKQDSVCSEAEWQAGEKVPHHARPPHRGNLDEAYGQTVPKPNPNPEDAKAEPDDEDSDTPGLAELSDEELRALWHPKPPLVSELLDAVGDDAALAARVKEAEEQELGGQGRTTLLTNLDKLTEAT